MPTFALPWLFGAAVAASLAVVGLHFLSVRRPPPLVLPTARFVPEGEARAVARQPRLNDVPLLLLRVLALLCAGAALAGMRWPNTRASTLRLVVAEERLAADSSWRDSVTRVLALDDALVDVHAAPGAHVEAGSVLVAATQRAAQLVTHHPTLSRVELTVVLPAASRSIAGFTAWRAQWPGAVRVVVHDEIGKGGRPATRASTVAPGRVSSTSVRVTGAERDDIVAAMFSLGGARPSSLGDADGAPPAVVIDRTRGESGAGVKVEAAPVVVHWPIDGVPTGWTVLTHPDTIGAVVANGTVLVGPFVRVAVPSPALRARLDSAQLAARPVRVLAWWSDGAPAALEELVNDRDPDAPWRCARTVAVMPPRGSDLLLSSAADGLRQVVSAPCGASVVSTRGLRDEQGGGTPASGGARAVGYTLSDTLSDTLGSAAAAAPADAFRGAAETRAGSDPWWLTPLLLGLSLVALLFEAWWRRREAA